MTAAGFDIEKEVHVPTRIWVESLEWDFPGSLGRVTNRKVAAKQNRCHPYDQLCMLATFVWIPKRLPHYVFFYFNTRIAEHVSWKGPYLKVLAMGPCRYGFTIDVSRMTFLEVSQNHTQYFLSNRTWMLATSTSKAVSWTTSTLHESDGGDGTGSRPPVGSFPVSRIDDLC